MLVYRSVAHLIGWNIQIRSLQLAHPPCEPPHCRHPHLQSFCWESQGQEASPQWVHSMDTLRGNHHVSHNWNMESHPSKLRFDGISWDIWVPRRFICLKDICIYVDQQNIPNLREYLKKQLDHLPYYHDDFLRNPSRDLSWQRFYVFKSSPVEETSHVEILYFR